MSAKASTGPGSAGGPPPPSYGAGEICDICGGELVWGADSARAAGAAYDSRRTGPGQLFFAVTGERTDGHLYLAEAGAAGATVFVVGRWDGSIAGPFAAWAEGRDVVGGGAGPALAVIKVDDPTLAVGKLAAHHRRRYNIPVIGITGSMGKTTAKDMTAHIVEGRYQSLVSAGNLNSHISLPIVLLQLAPSHQLAVLEMAARLHGDSHYLAELAEPATGVLTSVAGVHLETLGSLAGVAKTKAELLRALPATGLGIYPADSEPLRHELAVRPPEAQLISFGTGPDADVRFGEPVTAFRREGDAATAGIAFKITCRPGPAAERLDLPVNQQLSASLPYPGPHNAGNVIAAALAAASVGVPFASGLASLAGFRPKSEMRLDIQSLEDLLVIDDTYNASPLAMVAALKILAQAAAGGRQVAVLADMLELGPTEAEEHLALGRRVAGQGVDLLVTYGRAAEGIGRGAIDAGMPPDRVLHAASHDAVVEVLERHLVPGDAVLVKGSRGMAMENVVAALRAVWRRRAT